MRVGLIGPGNFAQRGPLPAIAMAPGVELTAVWGTNPDKSRKAAARFGGAVCASAEELVARPDVDAVFIVTPPAGHPALLRLAIEAGKPVICDKPVTLSTAELAPLVVLAAERGVPTAVDFEFRYDPGMMVMADLVRGGAVGTVHLSTYNLVACFANDPAFTSQRYWSFHHSAAEGGGLLPQVASHHIDLHRYVLGGLEAAGGYLATMIAERPTAPAGPGEPDGPPRRVEVEDCAALAGRLPDGGAAALAFTNVATSAPDLRWLIHGDKGSIAYHGRGGWFGDEIHLAEGWQGEPCRIAVPAPAGAGQGRGLDGWMEEMISHLLADFAEVVAGRSKGGRFATLADALANWQLIEAWRAGSARQAEH